MIEKILPTICELCGYGWLAFMEYANTKNLKCPSCGYMTPAKDVEETLFSDDGDTESCPLCGGRMAQEGASLQCEKCGYKDVIAP